IAASYTGSRGLCTRLDPRTDARTCGADLYGHRRLGTVHATTPGHPLRWCGYATAGAEAARWGRHYCRLPGPPPRPHSSGDNQSAPSRSAGTRRGRPPLRYGLSPRYPADCPARAGAATDLAVLRYHARGDLAPGPRYPAHAGHRTGRPHGPAADDFARP